MYNPTLQKVEVLKLEKRLDEELYYLRDAPQEFSTVPFNFEMVPHPPGAPVPINDIKVCYPAVVRLVFTQVIGPPVRVHALFQKGLLSQ